MESTGHVAVPLRAGGKKMRKRRELDALVAHSLAKRACNSGKRNIAGNGITSQDQLLSQSTDENEDYTWPKVRNPSRCRTKRLSCLKTCGPFVFITCIFMSFGFMYWLYFDLRQQINEYRMRIEQVTASSQNVPEALQKLHETSRYLEQNQTAIHNGMAEINSILKNFTFELTRLKETVAKTDPSSKENEPNVQKSLSEFGAQLLTYSSDIKTIRTQLNKFEENEKKTEENLLNLTQLIDTKLNSNSTISKSNIDQTEIKSLVAEIANVDKVFKESNNYLNQSVQSIEERISVLKTGLGTVREDIANLTAQISSVEQVWTQHKEPLVILESTYKNLTADMLNIQTNTNNLETKIEDVKTECQNYNRQSENITKELEFLKQTWKANDSSRPEFLPDPKETHTQSLIQSSQDKTANIYPSNVSSTLSPSTSSTTAAAGDLPTATVSFKPKP